MQSSPMQSPSLRWFGFSNHRHHHHHHHHQCHKCHIDIYRTPRWTLMPMSATSSWPLLKSSSLQSQCSLSIGPLVNLILSSKVSNKTITRLGRRVLLVASEVIMCACLVAIGVYFYLKSKVSNIKSFCQCKYEIL